MELQENKVVKENGESLLLYKTHGTCSQYIEVGVKEGRVTRCRFYGGCDGKTKGLAQLVVAYLLSRPALLRLATGHRGVAGLILPPDIQY